MGGRQRFETLDGMRGLAALIVATFHFDTALKSGHLLNHGWLSVDMFFVLSGFVIALAYEDKLKTGMGFSRFVGARARRLVPTQWLGTLVVALSILVLYLRGAMSEVAGFNPYTFAVAIIFALFLIPISWSPAARVFANVKDSIPINPPMWSLQGEWFINLVYAKFLYLINNIGLFSVYALAAAYLAAICIFGSGGWDDILSGLARATAGFTMGVLIYRWNQASALKWLPIIRPEIVYAAWFFVCALPRTHPMPVFEGISSLIIAPVLMALLVRAERPMPRVWGYMGKLSYPLYASHFAIVNLALLWAKWRENPLWAVPMLAASLLLATLVDRLASLRRIRQPYGSIRSSRPAHQTVPLD